MVQIFKRFFNFYINSSIHVALAVYALTWITLLEFKLPYKESILYFVFYASIVGYNFVKYYSRKDFKNIPVENWLKWIKLLTLICTFLMCFYAFQLQIKTLLIISVFGLLTFFYGYAFPKSFKVENLRHVTGIKVYIIALVWAGVTVFLPLIEADYIINFDVCVTAIQRFLFVVVLMIPFEIRDLPYDSKALKTLPQLLGMKLLKQLGFVLLLAFFGLEFLKVTIFETHLIVLCAITMLTLFFMLNAKEEQGKYYSSFWVESLPIVWLVLLLFR